MKKFFFLFFSLPLIANAQRQHINFDRDWKFHFGHAANAEKDFNYTIANIFSKSGAAQRTAIDPRFKDSAWRTLHLPHDWAVELPFVYKDNFDVMAHGYKPVGGLFPETSIGWYRKHFTVAKQDSGSRFQIQFDGIFRDANIWINGFFLGNNKSGYVGESYDITDYINFGRDNVIVVRADASQYEGWFYEGAGIYRHVWLNKYDNVHIATDGVFAWSAINSNKAAINVETTVQNQSTTASPVTISAYMTDRDGKIVAKAKDQTISVAVNKNVTTVNNLTLVNFRNWTLDDPYLYRVIVEVRSNGKLIDQQKIRFGLRHIDIKPNGVFLNGQHVKLFGVNNHQDHAGVGSALPDYLQYYRIRLLKNMGVNAYRTSHNAPTAELLDACDSLGMLVMDEQRLLNSSPEYMSQFERLIKRDRNHPSVFIWSIGNEEGWIHTTSVGKRIAQTFIAKQKELDPTRTCTYAADVPNVYNGINEVIPVRSFNYRQFAVA
ncbi:MAG: glycoside hydrolase family 2 TIM barrel-domain containing protein, partial [Bacteroidota bacterium]